MLWGGCVTVGLRMPRSWKTLRFCCAWMRSFSSDFSASNWSMSFCMASNVSSNSLENFVFRNSIKFIQIYKFYFCFYIILLVFNVFSSSLWKGKHNIWTNIINLLKLFFYTGKIYLKKITNFIKLYFARF